MYLSDPTSPLRQTDSDPTSPLRQTDSESETSGRVTPIFQTQVRFGHGGQLQGAAGSDSGPQSASDGPTDDSAAGRSAPAPATATARATPAVGPVLHQTKY